MDNMPGHWVVLDPDTLTGQIYASDNDGVVICGGKSCPALRCRFVDSSHRRWVSISRVVDGEGKLAGTFLSLPARSVCLIVDFDKSEYVLPCYRNRH